MHDRSPLDVIKPEIRQASAYTLEHLAADVKLDQNENPHEIPDFLKKKVAERFDQFEWGRYPEFVPTRILGALERFTGWPREGILAGNGSNELILATLVATVGAGRVVTIPQPTFTLYKLLAASMGGDVHEVPLGEDLTFPVDALVDAARGSDVVIICSPNNPTGCVIDPEDLAVIASAARGLVIVDEAYHEFSGQTIAPLLERFDNLIVLRTFSKAMSMAGLRFGYMLGNPALVAQVNKVKLPYNVNVFTLLAAEVLLEESTAIEASIRALIEQREHLREELGRLSGVEVFPSRANFLLFRTPHNAKVLFEELYQAGVLVRNVSHYPMLDRCLRVTVGTPDQNDKFMGALGRSLENLHESAVGRKAPKD
jgi:histidinol-phosphate aminotransferase